MGVIRVRKLFAGWFVALLLILPVSAQDETDETHPLIEMLAFVPDTEMNRERIIAFADINAGNMARGMDEAVSQVNLGTMTLEEFRESNIWYRVTLGLINLRFVFRNFTSDEVEPVMGFRFIDIQQTMLFGDEPSYVLRGFLDKDSIHDALSARDYEIVEETRQHYALV